MTAISLLCKMIGMLFRHYLIGRIGAEGIGLYQLIMSVYTLFYTFAIAGFGVAVSRLVAEALELDASGEKANSVLYSAIKLSLILSVVSSIIMLCLNNVFSIYLIKETKAVLPLGILTLSLPFMGVAACLKGAYIAHRKILISSVGSLLEQLVKILITVIALQTMFKNTINNAELCTAITLGTVIGEIFSTCYLYAFYRAKLYIKTKLKTSLAVISKITFTIAGSSYISSILHTCENMLIPYCFGLFGNDRANALAQFGIIKGIVIPIVFFPFAFLSSTVSILIPEIARLNTKTDKKARDVQIEKIISLSCIFSMGVGGLFFFFSEDISFLFYKSAEAAMFLKLIALVTPFMYIETITDGLLKSIGEERFTLVTSVLNSVVRIAVILVLVPQTGAYGYVWLLIGSNTFAFLMVLTRLKLKSTIKLKLFSNMFLPLAVTCVLCVLCKYSVGFLKLGSVGTIIGLASFVFFYLTYSFFSIKRAKINVV